MHERAVQTNQRKPLERGRADESNGWPMRALKNSARSCEIATSYAVSFDRSSVPSRWKYEASVARASLAGDEVEKVMRQANEKSPASDVGGTLGRLRQYAGACKVGFERTTTHRSLTTSSA